MVGWLVSAFNYYWSLKHIHIHTLNVKLYVCYTVCRCCMEPRDYKMSGFSCKQLQSVEVSSNSATLSMVGVRAPLLHLPLRA